MKIVVKMLKPALFISMLCLMLDGFSQSKKKKGSEGPLPEVTVSPYGRVSNIPLAIRLKNYPFKIASKIQLVSFDNTDGQILPGTKLYNNTPKLLVKWKTPFFQTKTLDANQIDELTDLLYNFCHLKPNFVTDFGACFNPKNAILFLNEKEEVFDLFMICFECKLIRTYLYRTELPCDCDHQIAVLKTFLKSRELNMALQKVSESSNFISLLQTSNHHFSSFFTSKTANGNPHSITSNSAENM